MEPGHLIFNFLAHEANQIANLTTVEISWMRDFHPELAADAAGVCVQDDDAISKAHRLANRVCDKEDRLVRLEPEILHLLVQQGSRLGVQRRKRLVHQ